MKKIVTVLILLSLFCLDFWTIVIADTESALPWKDAVVKCIEAYKKQDVKTMWSITNPFNSKLSLSCAWDTVQSALYQAILDVRFSKIDQEIEKYLKSLDWNTNAITANKELSEKFWRTWIDNYFYNQYVTACSLILNDAIALAKEKEFNITTNWLTKDILWKDTPNKCLGLASMKLNAYQEAWVVILARESAKSYSSSQENFFSDIRNKYEKLLFKFLNYLSQLWVIKNKWNTATPKAQTNP